jgi:hypothetical protein
MIDAALVRTMKARKRLSHNDLIAEACHQITLFQPQPRVIKSRIESLIEREYLERSEDDSNVYQYLA